MDRAPIPLTVYEGGKQDSPVEPKLSMSEPPSSDWLRALEYGDRFLSRGVSSHRTDFDQFAVAFKIDEAIFLAELQPMGNYHFRWVDSVRFSNLNKFIVKLPERTENEDEGHIP